MNLQENLALIDEEWTRCVSTTTRSTNWFSLPKSSTSGKGVGYGGYGKYGIFSFSAEKSDSSAQKKAIEFQKTMDEMFKANLNQLLAILSADSSNETSVHLRRSNGLNSFLNGYISNNSIDDMVILF